MEFVFTSTIEYITKDPTLSTKFNQIKHVTLLPLAMPLEMTCDAEWQQFYGHEGQLYPIYVKLFERLSIHCEWMNIFSMTEEEIIAWVDQSECVVILGGDAKALKTRFEMYPNLYHVLIKSNKLLVGESAGAKIWFDTMFVEHEDKQQNIHLEVTEGIGYFPTTQAIAVHVDFTQAQLSRLYALIQQSEITEIIALGNEGAIYYNTGTDQFETYGMVKIFQ